ALDISNADERIAQSLVEKAKLDADYQVERAFLSLLIATNQRNALGSPPLDRFDLLRKQIALDAEIDELTMNLDMIIGSPGAKLELAPPELPPPPKPPTFDET